MSENGVRFKSVFFQAEDGRRDLVRSRELGDVYKRQVPQDIREQRAIAHILGTLDDRSELNRRMSETCLLYTSDASDDLLCVDLGCRRII